MRESLDNLLVKVRISPVSDSMPVTVPGDGEREGDAIGIALRGRE